MSGTGRILYKEDVTGEDIWVRKLSKKDASILPLKQRKRQATSNF
jgi:hypothetical protein